jgi:hypothetical protein
VPSIKKLKHLNIMITFLLQLLRFEFDCIR